MKRRYVTVDVFTEAAFGGNPLAVVLEAEGLDTAAMGAIAREFGYSETTFVLPPADGAHTAAVRIFTPQGELPFAGHPNVGTAFALAREGDGAPTLLFEEGAGLVPVAVLRDGGAAVGAELTAPQPLRRVAMMGVDEAAACLSLRAGDVVSGTHPPTLAGVGLAFVLVEVASREALGRVRIAAGPWEAAMPFHGARSIYAYCRGEGGGGFDLHARLMWAGMAEDPATGSAAVALAALLAEGGADGEVRLRVEQGREAGRPSTLLTRVVVEGGAVRSAHVGGRCVGMMRGVLDV